MMIELLQICLEDGNLKGGSLHYNSEEQFVFGDEATCNMAKRTGKNNFLYTFCQRSGR